jgi:hypothetical protein
MHHGRHASAQERSHHHETNDSNSSVNINHVSPCSGRRSVPDRGCRQRRSRVQFRPLFRRATSDEQIAPTDRQLDAIEVRPRKLTASGEAGMTRLTRSPGPRTPSNDRRFRPRRPFLRCARHCALPKFWKITYFLPRQTDPIELHRKIGIVALVKMGKRRILYVVHRSLRARVLHRQPGRRRDERMKDEG